jgi:outer membrane protein assembly factor BamE
MSETPRSCLQLWLALALISALPACSALPEFLQPYRSQVVQGNVVTREQMAVLKPGMSRLQVREILGTPLLTSVFHSERWDYVFTLNKQGLPPQSRKVAVFFKGDALERFEAEALPSEAEFVATLGSGIKPEQVPLLQADPKVLEERAPPVKPKELKPLPPLPASYPPLEPLR